MHSTNFGPKGPQGSMARNTSGCITGCVCLKMAMAHWVDTLEQHSGPPHDHLSVAVARCADSWPRLCFESPKPFRPPLGEGVGQDVILAVVRAELVWSPPLPSSCEQESELAVHRSEGDVRSRARAASSRIHTWPRTAFVWPGSWQSSPLAHPVGSAPGLPAAAGCACLA